MAMATRPPAVMPFRSRPPARSASSSGNTRSYWQPTPTQNATPTMRPLRWSMPPCTTSVMPRTKSMASSTVTYAAATELGIASIRASSFGRNASVIRRAPPAIPTRRAATPVSSTTGTLIPMVWVGMIPAKPASSLPMPSAATAPSTAR